MPVRSDGPDDGLDRLRERLLGVEEQASVKSWFPRLRQTVARLAESEARLRHLNEELEAQVASRTEELKRANEELAAKNAALETTLAELRSSREALLRSERLAATATLAGKIAHELNSPLGALVSSSAILADLLADAVDRLAIEGPSFDAAESAAFRALLRFGANAILENPERIARVAERVRLEEALARRGVGQDAATVSALMEIGLDADSELLDTAIAEPHAATAAHRMIQTLSAAAVARRSGERAAEVIRRLQRSVAEGFEGKDQGPYS